MKKVVEAKVSVGEPELGSHLTQLDGQPGEQGAFTYGATAGVTPKAP